MVASDRHGIRLVLDSTLAMKDCSLDMHFNRIHVLASENLAFV